MGEKGTLAPYEGGQSARVLGALFSRASVVPEEGWLFSLLFLGLCLWLRLSLGLGDLGVPTLEGGAGTR